jgi:hypothetical protein
LFFDLSAKKGIRQKNFRFFVLDPLSTKKITGRPAIQWAAIAATREKVGIFIGSYLMECIFIEEKRL